MKIEPTKNQFLRFALSGALIFSALFLVVPAQDLPDPSPNIENIPSGSLVIPMDAKQVTTFGGNSRFNLKAYGLVQRLLQNNIPMKWAIKAGKSKDDIDFSQTAARVYPTAIATAPQDFSGGPFIIQPGYEAMALGVIDDFRTEVEDAYPADATDPANDDDDAAADVQVFRLTAAANVDIRYTLTHKPKPAYGAANGGFGGAVHAELFESALITDYSVVDDNTVNAGTCITIATQPHSTSPDAFVDNYRVFVESGGNLLLQCLSVTTFENSPVFGFFQTTTGWLGLGEGNANGGGIDDIPTYPNGDMAFSQFLGTLNNNQIGTVEDWRLSNGSAFANGTYPVTQNLGANANSYSATSSKVGNAGQPGGVTFALGGHNYFRDDDNNVDLDVDRINGQRMILNALFVPVTRPSVCNTAVVSINGYKAVRVTTDTAPVGPRNPGDTVTWTIDYINVGPIIVNNFQITDVLPASMTLVAVPTVSDDGTGTSAAVNAGYTGT
ncbi:MAG: hypothetical protein WBD22_05485, partial [Pyrinomonadaceae bacterium]